jgi:hypothetical protein
MVTGAVLLAGPVTTFAATSEKAAEPADAISEEEVLDAVENAATMPMMDGRGGGGYSIMPPYSNGVMVDASVTKEVTPDFVALNAYCDSGRQASREDAKEELNQLFAAIKTAVGSDGRVRRMGTITAYPYYGQNGEETGSYSANLSLFIRIVNMSAAQRISEVVEDNGCSVNWDVRLVDMQDFELDVLDELTERLNKRKTVFEKLLGKKLTNVTSASLNTWADGYSTYDPETNKVDATTTLSVSFNIGARTALPSTPSTTSRNRTPRG